MARCSNMMCTNEGALKCTRCREAVPPTLYCSARCQQQDWQFHKTYCGKTAYTFELTLVGSSDPVIERTFDVPAWYTFKQLHYTIQYAMGPWQHTHLHEFTFSRPSAEPRYILSPTLNDVLKIRMSDAGDDEIDFSMIPGMRRMPVVPKESEDTVLLKDVYDPAGRLRNLIGPATEPYPLYYLYDFGDHWEHELIFKGSKLARESRPVFTSASGCGPVEDCGAVQGWNQVKAAFKVRNPSKAQRDRILWAREVSGLGKKFDPLQEPNVVHMNYEGRWENHLHDYMRMSGEYTSEWGSEEDEDVAVW